MSYTNGLDKPTDYFNTNLWTGNGTTATGITGVGFQPDMTWIKERSQIRSHVLFDVIRGATVQLNPNDSASDATVAESLQSFDSDGFTVGNATSVNQSGETYVGWNWIANGTASSNTDGSITSNVSANTTSGFSIVSWTGTGTNPSTIGHGLGTAPSCIILKNRDASGGIGDWYVGHDGIGWTDRLKLNTTATTAASSTLWNNTAPTSSVFTISSALNFSGDNTIAYCFAPKKGFSAMGQYTGNGSTDGTFIYTGFKPAMIIVKRTDDTRSWLMYDNKRDSFNVVDLALSPNLTNAEDVTSSDENDFLSNGIKMRNLGNALNASGGTYIYMCFAENPLVSSAGVPCTAR